MAFHGKTVHGAPGNSSNLSSRRAISLRFVGEDARVAERPWTVSPPEIGGLSTGQSLAENPEEYPVLWRAENS